MGDNIRVLTKEEEDIICTKILEKVNAVYSIFSNFYGEDYVDLQSVVSREYIIEESNNQLKRLNQNLTIEEIITNIRVSITLNNLPFILVYFPQVTVTNEYDESTEITELYAKVYVDYDGGLSGKFKLNRAEYTVDQIKADYMHSHVDSIPTEDFTKFRTPCTGTGPIIDTICTLNRGYDEDFWNLFCLELSKYVTVESVSGTPYKRLNRIGMNNLHSMEVSSFRTVYSYHLTVPEETLIGNFIKYIISEKILKFRFDSNKYTLASSFVETTVILSNAFIKWYNNNHDYNLNKEYLFSHNFLYKSIVNANNIIITDNDGQYSEDTYTSWEGEPVCTFKGGAITMHVIPPSIELNKDDNKSILLQNTIISFIIFRILRILNYRYGREEKTDPREGISYF